MKYRQISPPDYLKGYIRYFWTLESGDPDTLPTTFGPMADGCPGIIFQLSDRAMFYNEKKQYFPAIFLYGQTIKPIKIHALGRVNTIGVFFYPHALKSIFGFDANELTDSCLDLNHLAEEQGFCLSEQLLNAPSEEGKIEILSSYLLGQIRKNKAIADPITHYVLSQIIQSNGSISLKALLVHLQLSERSLERKFKQGVGIPPKLFAKVCRFQASLHQLRARQYDNLSDIAFDNGYADQSHFIRTFKELSGFSPYQFQKKSSEVVENFPQLIK